MLFLFVSLTLQEGEPVEFSIKEDDRGRKSAERVTGPMGAFVQGAPPRSDGGFGGGFGGGYGDSSGGGFGGGSGGFGGGYGDSSGGGGYGNFDMDDNDYEKK